MIAFNNKFEFWSRKSEYLQRQTKYVNIHLALESERFVGEKT